MRDYRYIFIRGDGLTYVLTGMGREPTACPLNLIWEGWRPIREVPMGEGAALVLLERT